MSAAVNPAFIRPTKAKVYNPWPKRIESSFGGYNYKFAPGISEFESMTAEYILGGPSGLRMVPSGRKEPLEVCLRWFFGYDASNGTQGGGTLGLEGLRVLSGIPEVDEEIKKEADKAYQAKRFSNAWNKKLAYDQAVKYAMENKQAPPLPDKDTQEAQKFLTDGDKDHFRCNAPGFGCWLPFDTAEQRDQHIRETHGESQHFQNWGVNAQRGVVVPTPDTSNEMAELRGQVAALTDLVGKLAAGKVAPVQPPKGYKKRGRPPKQLRPIEDPEENQ